MSLPFAFQRPEALLLLVLVPVLVLAAVVGFRSRRRALTVFAGRGSGYVSSSAIRQQLKAALLLAAVVAVIFALAGPTSGTREREVKQQGVDLVIALDVSQSMAARDVAPDRLRAASEAITSLSRQLSGSRVALVIFAGQAVVRYPPTTDPDVLGEALSRSGRSFRVQAGTAMKTGLVAALAAFPQEVRDLPQRKAIVFLSDGEDTTADDLPDLASLRQRGVRVYALGVGTAAGGVIPTFDDNGKFLGNLVHPNGQPVITHLEEKGLRDIATATGGRYWQYTGGDSVVKELVGEIRTLDTSELSSSAGATPDDRFQLLVAIAVLAVLAEWLIGDRRPMPTPRAIGVMKRERRARAW